MFRDVDALRVDKLYYIPLNEEIAMLLKDKLLLIYAVAMSASLSGCIEPESSENLPASKGNLDSKEVTDGITSCDNADQNGMALFGDVHIHTRYSFDAAANSTGTTPEDAHRYARGEEIPIFPINEEGVALGRTKIDRPLDFIAVTDHGEFLGERRLCRSSESPVYGSAFCKEYRSDERLGMIMLSNSVVSEAPIRIPEICG
ncbi:MAG: DUF3604 domain-containing protein, partial [Porticoccaceae bacterium]|nr:DUF3604 domain-containing protein [Porticoccaceae bacterium]